MAQLKTNEKNLVKMAIQGKVSNAMQFGDFEIKHDGSVYSCPSVGGIVYNVKTGDPTFGWEADHIEPGVSALLDEKNRGSKQNMGFNFLACVGNKATLRSGDAKGAVGTVTGHHGGVEHVTIDFDDDVLQKMTMDDKILIEAYGQGLKLEDFPDVKVYNLDPYVLHKLPIKAKGKSLEVGVTHIVPAGLMGSGMGHNNIGTGDCDIMTHDAKTVKELKLDKLCLGDIVAVQDHDHSYGRTYRKNAVTIGIVIHGNSDLAGHGPGLSTLLTCSKTTLKPVLDKRANLARILGIGRYR